MKRRITLMIALLILLCGCTAGPAADSLSTAVTPAVTPTETSAQAPSTGQYRREKVCRVADIVLEREIVPSDYFRYLDEETTAQVEAYNEATVSLRDYYVKYALQTLLFVTGTKVEEEFDCYDLPDIQYQWISRISHYALYRDAEYLCRGDELLSYPCGMESGGSGGLWVGQMHKADYVGAAIAQMVEDYFTLVDRLLVRLEEQL